MASAPLYTPFRMPPTNDQVSAAQAQAQPRTKSFLFDYELGDFVRDGAGRILKTDGPQKVASWCIKALLTERFAWIVYPHNYGVEFEPAMTGGPPRGIAESVIRHNATEALSQHRDVRAVESMTFAWLGDAVTIDIRIALRTREGDDEHLQLRFELMGFG